jgi:hypothetical protein
MSIYLRKKIFIIQASGFTISNPVCCSLRRTRFGLVKIGFSIKTASTYLSASISVYTTYGSLFCGCVGSVLVSLTT